MHDPFSGRPTFICGATLPSASGTATLLDNHQRRLAALDRVSAAAAKCGLTEDTFNDPTFFSEASASLIAASGEPRSALGRAILNLRHVLPLLPLEKFGFQSHDAEWFTKKTPFLRYIGGGVEAWAFQSEDGSVYKFFMPHADSPCIGATFRFLPGDGETVLFAEAVPGSYRDLLEKLDVINRIGGMAVEVLGVTVDRILIVKQTLGQRLPEHSDMGQFLPASLIPWPSRFLRCDRDHPRLAFVQERPWLVADLHERNIVLDTNGQPRIIDLVASPLPADLVASFPMLRKWLKEVGRDPASSLLGTVRDEDL